MRLLSDIGLVCVTAVALTGMLTYMARPTRHLRVIMVQQAAVARARQAQQAAAAIALHYWHALQQEVLAELAAAPQLPPPPQGRPSPHSEVPPIWLYHGTDRRNLGSVYARGIEGRSHGLAYAASDYQTAASYGRRWGRDYIVLRINAQQAYMNGVAFTRNGSYWTTPRIHPAFVDWHWTLADLWHRQHRTGLAPA